MQESHCPWTPEKSFHRIEGNQGSNSIHTQNAFSIRSPDEVAGYRPKPSGQNESIWYALYFQTMFSSEPVFCGGTARQQCLPMRFLHMSGLSPNPHFEISWRALLQWHWPNKGAAVLSSLIFSCSPNAGQLGKKTSLNIKRNKNLSVNVVVKTTSI